MVGKYKSTNSYPTSHKESESIPTWTEKLIVLGILKVYIYILWGDFRVFFETFKL